MAESQSRNDEGYDQKALDAASREVHLMLLREGSHWGIKACEEMGRVFMTAYRNALPSETKESKEAYYLDLLLRLADDGWLMHGEEGMDPLQEEVYAAIQDHPEFKRRKAEAERG